MPAEDAPTPADPAGTTDPTVTPSPPSPVSDGWADRRAWLREAFVPHSGLYSDRQPSIAETVRRARRGKQVADKGLLRLAGTAHGYAAAANKALCDTWVWIVSHPARLFVFGVLLGLAMVFPATRQVLHLVLTPFVWAHTALD